MASRRGSLTLGPTRTPSSSRSSRSYVPFCPSDFFFSSRRRHTRWPRDWSSDECSSDLLDAELGLEIENHLLGILGTTRKIDRDASQHNDVAAGGRHLAGRAHADVIGLVDLVLAAHDN